MLAIRSHQPAAVRAKNKGKRLQCLIHYNKDTDMLESFQRRVMGLGKGLEHNSDKEQLRKLRVYILEKRRLRGDPSLITSP